MKRDFSIEVECDIEGAELTVSTDHGQVFTVPLAELLTEALDLEYRLVDDMQALADARSNLQHLEATLRHGLEQVEKCRSRIDELIAGSEGSS